MRAKSYLVGFIFIVATTILILTFGDQHPKIQSLVSETHRQLKNNLRNIKDKFDGRAEDKKLEADERYLSLLGFGEKARLYPEDVWHNSSLPVFVTYVLQGDADQAVGLARNIAHFLPNHTLLVYYFGLPDQDYQALATYCNSSRCVLVKFDLSVFPSHVSDDKIHAFRPLIIQDALSRAGAVLYLDSDQRVVTSRLDPLLAKTRSSSLLTWRTKQPVTALTHPRMFKYFSAKRDSFFFLPMVEVGRLLVFNTGSVHAHIMLPWVQCALTHDCILPIGAQSGGCRFDKKPYYRYSGCHSYDASALNIVLGLHFKFDADQYALLDEEGYFKRVAELAVPDNTTDLTPL